MSRQNKDPVHKCHSDPGTSGKSSVSYASTKRITHRQIASLTGSSTRKCVLTLDGYNYVIVASPPDRRVTRDDIAITTFTPATNPSENGNENKNQNIPSTTRACNPPPSPSPDRNKPLSKQGTLMIVRRSSGKGSASVDSSNTSIDKSKMNDNSDSYSNRPTVDLDALLDNVDLATDSLPPVDMPDACEKAALRLRCLLRQLPRGEISADLLQRNLHYAARVLEAVFLDESKASSGGHDCSRSSRRGEGHSATAHGGSMEMDGPPGHTMTTQKRKLRTPVWAREPELTEKDVTCRPSVRRRRLADEDDELSEVQPDAVPPEVREWLASTFTRQLATPKRKADEKPKFRSVAHAIRAGIFVERISRRVTSSALMQFPPEVVKVLKTLDDWSFDAFSLSDASNGAPIKYLGYDLLNRYGMIHKFKVPPQVLENFLTKIEEGYCRYRNPYHNNLHAADVAQTMHYVLCQTGLMNWLSDLEIFATLVAAIIHDYEHTGTTNNFHVMSGSETALLYNDRAVLENHHISASFRILKDEDCNILQNLSREEFREFRTLVIDMVLATDMSFHFQQLKNMKNLLSLAEPNVDKSKAVSLVLHCCDISHPAKRWDLHQRWTMQLLEEFFRQGDKERALGLPFSPLCDRNNTLVAESQIGFIEFIVEPSMQVCSDMLEIVLAPFNPKENLEESSIGSSDERRTKIAKPWIHCLGENKIFWKEQALRDAESKAQKEAEQKFEDDKKCSEPALGSN